ncbi:MAG: lipid-A-disaccharide synthase [Bacteroidales bacterium]|jgi:lipid-A-disaccharide synthase|nr:lipid-A-disaccharide synthase [Bacteroidales bacterium]MDD2203838.1 lipid-A-disaccharide synthase [Bacteroidales bacterium]MDD3152812.1 lipid-A-disaccharide synthase [Bacteroidales bacterium]MDD3913146.1 lipid-A-disaccharide synthase [Bacteroidales bacterium]MDD4633061.1 lipid-A-disaccharide synthase [Bacteroidales bacterium]
MKYYIIAGEVSGDIHGANLVREIKGFDNNSEFRAWGGANLKKEGASIVKDVNEMSFMGFVEILGSIVKIAKLLRLCKSDILKYKPDVVILIDYPGFNLKIAKFAKRHNFKVIYYISPQIWAWHKSRIHKVKRYVDLMIPILPFEKDFYEKHGVTVSYFGHPLIDELSKYQHLETKGTKDHIALLPGSRKSEISKMLPVFCETARLFPDEKFVVASMSIHTVSYYENLIRNKPDNLSVVVDQTYQALANAKAALVTSGTATLETAIFRVPQVVCYKTNFISYLLAKQLTKVRYISLVNLILNRQLIIELIQNHCNKNYIATELKRLIEDKEYRAIIEKGYEELSGMLNNAGASKRAAEAVVNFVLAR